MMAAAVNTPGISWVGIAPVISLMAAALIIVMIKAVFRRDDRIYDASIAVAVAGVAASGYFLWRLWEDIRASGPYLTISQSVAIDGFSVFLGTVVLIATLLTLLLSSEYLERRGIASSPPRACS
jgi:NADH:ubiquinone oxidoreductase subunit 2 (subunit N)